MSLTKKILLSWLGIGLAGFVLYFVFPSRDFETITLVNVALMVLLGILAIAISRKDPNPNNKLIFLNFAIVFLSAFLFFLNYFVGRAFFTSHPYASVFSYQYITGGLFFFLLTFSIVYVVIDTVFRDIRAFAKYLITFLLVGSVFGYYYSPMIQDPMYLYKTEDIEDWKVVDKAVLQLNQQGVANPTVEEIAANVTLNAWKDGKQVGMLFEEQKVQRVAALLPYLEGSNYLTLLYKPIHLNVIYMNVFCIFAIFLFFGYQYRHDPPQGAYIEKIVFLLLPFCSLEILHFFGYIMSVEHATYLEYYRVGQYASLFNVALLIIFFALRLSFVTSIKGEFYERELVYDAEHISRWRDGIDSLLVRHFLNPETLHGRLFAPRPPRKEA